MKLPGLTITKAMYNEAKQMEKIKKDIMDLDIDYEIKIQLFHEVNDLIENQEDYFFNGVGAYNIIREYERREKHTEIPFTELRDKSDRNTYRFILQNETSFESKFFYCKYDKELKKAKVLTVTPSTKSVSFDTLEGDFQEVICTERNNNLDLKDNEWWTKKLAMHLENLVVDKINKL